MSYPFIARPSRERDMASRTWLALVADIVIAGLIIWVLIVVTSRS